MLQTLAHFVIPRQSNNHKAKLIHSSTLTVIALMLVLLQGVFWILPKINGGSNGQVLGYAANIAIGDVIRLTNEKRAQEGLPTLTENSVLDQAALAKGTDMLNKGYWAHVAPDGTQPWAFFASAHYNYKYAGENLARDFSSASAAVDAWMASPSHRENMLSNHYKEIGIGVVEGQLGGVDTTIIVQFFGTKVGDAPAPAAVAKVNPTALATSKPLAKSSSSPTAIPVAVASAVPSPTAIAAAAPAALVASSQVTPFDITRYVSLGLVAVLIVVVAVDGFIVNRRKVFRIAGHWTAHFAFLGMILAIVLIAKAGRII